ncbi:MAG: hypothetical protein WCR67_02205 [Bacilli bacterium]
MDLIQESLQKGNIVKDFRNNGIDLLEYSLEKFASFPYAVIISNGDATAKAMGFKAQQKITAANYYTPDVNYSSSSSSSLFMKTKACFYDRKNGHVSSYTSYGMDNLDKAKRTDYSYDKYINVYGKLDKMKYYVVNKFTSKDNLLHDGYLTSDDKEYQECDNSSKRVIYGTIIYLIDKDTVKNQSVRETADGFEISFDLDEKTADDYYATKMVTTGNLYELPTFYSSKITFYLDRELNLIRSLAFDSLRAKTGFINTDINMESENFYFGSQASVFETKNGPIDISVPDVGQEFLGYQLTERLKK